MVTLMSLEKRRLEQKLLSSEEALLDAEIQKAEMLDSLQEAGQEMETSRRNQVTLEEENKELRACLDAEERGKHAQEMANYAQEMRHQAPRWTQSRKGHTISRAASKSTSPKVERNFAQAVQKFRSVSRSQSHSPGPHTSSSGRGTSGKVTLDRAGFFKLMGV